MNIPYITEKREGWLCVEGIGDFSVFRTFDCGQCFRFDPVEVLSFSDFTYEVEGIAYGRYVRFAEDGGGRLFVLSSERDFEEIWRPYLSLDRDYCEINSRILSSLSGLHRDHMERAAEASRGIRILRQEPWEALCSFIISQNNNIPRIKKIIAAMCEKYGEKICGGYAFPGPEVLAEAGEEEIFGLRCGFRAKYICDAAERVSSGELSLAEVKTAKNYAEAESLLLTVKGVGPKVAACALLFGFERLEAFPVDVWIKRVIERRFEGGLDHTAFGPYAGIAQQYLFYFERYVADTDD